MLPGQSKGHDPSVEDQPVGSIPSTAYVLVIFEQPRTKQPAQQISAKSSSQAPGKGLVLVPVRTGDIWVDLMLAVQGSLWSIEKLVRSSDRRRIVSGLKKR
ncbi:hypothetical protein RRG08_011624 [Elysia crispata]|uniref:Uncharacterized protein n=1 Tax=Elysia crispata TaxID=231223 RepID=A0AAE0XP38_9GAST|nr:hypothetical protein RRG08_011624 [Elysia crispata]